MPRGHAITTVLVADDQAEMQVGDELHNFKVVGKPFWAHDAGRLTFPKRQHVVLECRCGNRVIHSIKNLRKNTTKSCGCLRKKRSAEACLERTKHGGKRELLYSVWSSMRQRCGNPKCRSFAGYGARGISVCDEWADYNAFRVWALANGYKPGLSLDRRDTDGNYEPGNCQWITRVDNSRKVWTDLKARIERLEARAEAAERALAIMAMTMRGVVKAIRQQ